MRSSRPSLAPSASAAEPVEIPDRECDAPNAGLPVAELIVLPRRPFGESPFTKTSLPCSSTWVAIWARNGVESANSAPAASTATGMQFFFRAPTHYLTASLGEGRALCFLAQTKDTHTAKKEASPS